jgi:hypothetical protein
MQRHAVQQMLQQLLQALLVRPLPFLQVKLQQSLAWLPAKASVRR